MFHSGILCSNKFSANNSTHIVTVNRGYIHNLYFIFIMFRRSTLCITSFSAQFWNYFLMHENRWWQTKVMLGCPLPSIQSQFNFHLPTFSTLVQKICSQPLFLYKIPLYRPLFVPGWCLCKGVCLCLPWRSRILWSALFLVDQKHKAHEIQKIAAY